MNLLASLRYLVALHEHRHFGRAAQACHITQPALSNALRALEKEFGVVVVRRGRSFEGFTPEGERVLATAQRMLHEHQVLQQDLSSDAAHPRGTLRLGAVPTAMPILARFAAQLQARHPGIVPVALSMSSQALEAGLENISLDLALGYTERMPARGGPLRAWPQYVEHYFLLRRAPRPPKSPPRRLQIGPPHGLGRRGGAAAVPAHPRDAQPQPGRWRLPSGRRHGHARHGNRFGADPGAERGGWPVVQRPSRCASGCSARP